MTDTAQAGPEERVALVTGATGAIGAAVCRTLVDQASGWRCSPATSGASNASRRRSGSPTAR